MRLSLFFGLMVSLVACGSSSTETKDSGSQQGSDSGVKPGDPAPATVSIASTCTPITPCGGDVEGAWDYTGGCAELDLSALTDACPAIQIKNTSATVRARVSFAGGSVQRTYTVTGTATLAVPASCAQPAGGCASLQSDVGSQGTTAACTDDGSGGCNCDISSTTNDEGSTTYTVQGNTIVTGDGNKYDFCVQGGSMSYSHSDGPSPELGVFTLSKN